MKMKRFFAKDMRTALQDVKAELGANAVIMSNKKVSGGIEIVAAIDMDAQPQRRAPAQAAPTAAPEAPAEQVDMSAFNERLHAYAEMQQRGGYAPVNTPAPTRNERPQPAPQQQTNSTRASLSSLLNEQQQKMNEQAPQESARFGRSMQPQHGNGGHATTASNDTAMMAMQGEMQAIRQLLEHQIAELMWQDMERREPVRAMLVQRLKDLGLAPGLADQFACYISEDIPVAQAWQQVRQLLAEQLVVTDDDVLRRGGVVSLLGPTGVGKTTTIAKLAARYAQLHGADQVALVTTDTYRIGALDQLAIYGKILGCPVKQVRNAEELNHVLYQFRNRRLVLIDTAGMGQRDMRLSEQLNTLTQDPHVKISNYLVLAANAQTPVLQDAIERFRRVPLSGCIFTKLDECLSLGEAISVSIQNALPIGYLTDGQRVPEDIRIASADYMVNTALELLEASDNHAQGDYTGSAAPLSSGHKDTKYNVGPGKWA